MSSTKDKEKLSEIDKELGKLQVAENSIEPVVVIFGNACPISVKKNDSGNSYLIKFDKDGYVKTLYVGNFVDGKYKDETGNAWGISRNDEGGPHYMYSKGKYEENSCADKQDFKNYLTLDQINEYIKGYVFNCELQWLMDD